MLSEARIREETRPSGLDWIRALVEAGDVEMSLFDERDLVEVTRGALSRGTPQSLPQSATGRGAHPQALGAALRPSL